MGLTVDKLTTSPRAKYLKSVEIDSYTIFFNENRIVKMSSTLALDSDCS